MVDNDNFGNNENPWDNDPSKNSTPPPVPPQHTPEQTPSEPTQPVPAAPIAPIPPQTGMPTPPPPPSAPGVGTYYGNAQGYNVSGPKNDGLSIASMIIGIIGLLGSCCWILVWVLDVLAIVLGLVGMKRIKKSNGSVVGKGFATAGLVLGIIGLVIAIIIGVLVLINSDSNGFNYYYSTNN